MYLLTPTCSICGYREIMKPDSYNMISIEFDDMQLNYCKTCLERRYFNEQSNIKRKHDERRRNKDN